MSQLLDNFVQPKNNIQNVQTNKILSALFLKHFQKFQWLQPQSISINQQFIQFGFTYIGESDLSIVKQYFFLIIFYYKNNQVILSAKWILNGLPMKSKISQANYFYAFQAIKILETITGDKNLKLVMNPFRETFGILWTIFLPSNTFSQFLLTSRKLLQKVMKALISKIQNIDSIINQFLIGAHNKTSINPKDIHMVFQKDISKMVCFLTNGQLYNKAKQQIDISLLSHEKFVSKIQQKYLRASQKILKFSLSGIYGGFRIESCRKDFSVETINKFITGSDKFILQQDPYKEQTVSFININLKACNLQKDKPCYIKINTSTNNNITSASKPSKNLLKIRIVIPSNYEEELLFIHQSIIVSTFLPKFKSKHFQKYYINSANFKQFPVRMTLDQKQMTLKQFLSSRQGWISFKTKIYILRQILYGMKKLWKQKVIYLGLSSQTVMVSWKKGLMNVKITNLGHSFHEQLCINNASYHPNLSSEYNAPQLKLLLQTQQGLSPKQDLYSFGILITQIFFQKLPLLYPNRSTRVKDDILLKASTVEGLKWQQNFCQIVAKLAQQCMETQQLDRPDPEFVSLILGYLAGF